MWKYCFFWLYVEKVRIKLWIGIVICVLFVNFEGFLLKRIFILLCKIREREKMIKEIEVLFYLYVNLCIVVKLN